MTKKIALALLAVSTCLSAQASEVSTLAVDAPAVGAVASTNVDYFGNIQRLFFAEGQVPTDADITGWYSGRCYYAADRTTAQNGILLGFAEVESGDGSPLFPGREVHKFASAINRSKGVDYFDSITPEMETDLTQLIAAPPAIPSPVVSNGSLTVFYDATTQWQLRAAQGYLVMAWMNQGTEYAYCYYFKKVKN